MQILLIAESNLINGEDTTSSKIEVINTRRLVLRVVRSIVLEIVRYRVATYSYVLRIVGYLSSTRTLLVVVLELVSVGPLVVRILGCSSAVEVIEEDNRLIDNGLVRSACCQINLLTSSTGCQVDIVNAGCDACLHLDVEVLSSLLQREVGRRLIPRLIIRAGIGNLGPLLTIGTQRELELGRVERSIVVAVLVTLNTPLHMQILLAIESDLVDSEATTSREVEVVYTRRLVLSVVRVVVLDVVRGRIATNGYALRIVGNLGSTRTLLVVVLELVSIGPLAIRILRRSLAIEVVSEDNLGVSLLTLLLDVDRTLEQNGRNDNLGLTSRACITAHGYG